MEAGKYEAIIANIERERQKEYLKGIKKRKLTITLEFDPAPVYDKDGNVIGGTDEEYIRDILYTIESSVGEKITSVKLDGVEMQEK